MPKDPIVSIRQQKQAYEAQQSTAGVEAVKKLAMDRVVKSAPSGFLQRASNEQLQAAVEVERKKILQSQAAASGQPIIADPSATPSRISIPTIGRAAASNLLDVMDSAGGGPRDTADALGLGAVRDAMSGEKPRLDDTGQLVSIGSSAVGAAIPQMRAARVGTTLGKGALQSIGGASFGAGVAGFVQQHLESAQDMIDAADALQEAKIGHIDAVMSQDIDLYSGSMRALAEATAEAGTSGIFAFGPNLAKAAFAKFAGIDGVEADRVIKLAGKYGVGVGLQDVASNPLIYRARDILGKFPTIGGNKYVAAARRQAGEIGDAIPASFGRGLAPQVTAALELAQNDSQRRITRAHISAFNRMQDSFKSAVSAVDGKYAQFKYEADKAGATVGNFQTAFTAMVELGKIRKLPTVSGGKPDKIVGDMSRVEKQLVQIFHMDPDPSLNAFINKGTQIESLIEELPPGSAAAGSLIRVKQAMEIDIQKRLNAPQEVLKMRDIADASYAELKDLFSGQAARRMKRVDKSFGRVRQDDVFIGPDGSLSVTDPGTQSPETVISALLDTSDPGVIRNLRTILRKSDPKQGDEAFKEIVGIHIARKIEGAKTTMKNLDGVDVTDTARLRKDLGLDNKLSEKYAATRMMFAAAGSDVRMFSEVLDLADRYFKDGVPDISTFITRRAVLGGAGSALRTFNPMQNKGDNASAFTFVTNVAKAAATQLALIRSGMSLTDPFTLTNLRVLLDPKKSVKMRMHAVQRLVMYDAAFLAFDGVMQEKIDRAQGKISMGFGEMMNIANDQARQVQGQPMVVDTPLPAQNGGVR